MPSLSRLQYLHYLFAILAAISSVVGIWFMWKTAKDKADGLSQSVDGISDDFKMKLHDAKEWWEGIWDWNPFNDEPKYGGHFEDEQVEQWFDDLGEVYI